MSMIKRRIAPLVVTLFVAVVLLCACRNSADSSSPSMAGGNLSQLRVNGSQLVDQTGKVITLRGFQGLGFYPIDKNLMLQSLENGDDPFMFDPIAIDLARFTLSEFDLSEIRSTGANVVRLWFDLHELQRQPGVYSEQALNLLEETINRFGQNGIYVIPVLGGTGQNTFVESQFYIDRGLSFWNRNNGLWDRSLDLWRKLAEQLKDNPYIAGYDLLNEPAAPDAQTLHAFYEEAISAIRNVGDNHIIILEADVVNPTPHQLGGTYSDGNLVASFHFYYPVNFTLLPDQYPNLTYPGVISGTYWDRATLDQALATALAADQLQGMPVYVGEFGADGARADDAPALHWIEDMLSLLNEHDLHYTYHNYRSSKNYKGYWFIKPDVAAAQMQLQQDVANGSRLWGDVTDEEKQQLFTTTSGYERRVGVKELLTPFLSAP